MGWNGAWQGGGRVYLPLPGRFCCFGSPGSAACLNQLLILKRICAELGIPLAIDKQLGPTAIIVFLCITIDTIRRVEAARRQTEEAVIHSGSVREAQGMHLQRPRGTDCGSTPSVQRDSPRAFIPEMGYSS